MKSKSPHEVAALWVRQWLPEWDGYRFDDTLHQAKPEPGFYVFSLSARALKRLTGVYRRSAQRGVPRALDQNIQRGHEEERSERIRDFVENGFPWCDMGTRSRSQAEEKELKKPGWLPTAIIINVLRQGDSRNGQKISPSDLVSITATQSTSLFNLALPKHFSAQWEPKSIYPFEVIDGQHRLWAFDGSSIPDDFELPVVAFHGLDRAWQAYLFWSINITPKRINRSLAFDLYPLLRQQSWLDQVEGIPIYRETRCQELVEALWGHPQSPWHFRINMLGEPKDRREYQGPAATQAAWVRSLMATFVKQWAGPGTKIGGLFGGSQGGDESFLRWNRPMQAAFLILAANCVRDGIAASKDYWASDLRKIEQAGLFERDDVAFYGNYSLLATDQGVRGILHIINDLVFIAKDELDLSRWNPPYKKSTSTVPATEHDAVSTAISSLEKTDIAKFLRELGRDVASFDWRTSSTPSLSQSEKTQKSAFRGSGGYKELRLQLINHLTANASKRIRAAAGQVRTAL